jgi:hypothetical protein
VRDGRHTGFDPARLAREAAAARDAIRSANAGRAQLAEALEAAIGSYCIGLCRRPFPIHRYGGPPDL